MKIKMEILKIINENQNQFDYKTRLTVKAIVLDESGNTAIFSELLLDGGVEEGETVEQVLHRECREEAGIKIEIIRPLGIVVQYRDILKRKYEVHGFLARLTGGHGLPTTEQVDEIGKTMEWLPVSEARSIFEKRITGLETVTKEGLVDDAQQGKLYNTITALTFLDEATRNEP